MIDRLMNVVFYGADGKPGLISRVDKMEDVVGRIETLLGKILWGVLAAVGIALLNLVIKH